MLILQWYPWNDKYIKKYLSLSYRTFSLTYFYMHISNSKLILKYFTDKLGSYPVNIILWY